MSSANNKFISNQQAIPIIPCDIFNNQINKRFALVMLGPEEVANYQTNDIAAAYLRLRANVYIDQTRMIECSHRRNDGTELDEDDLRSMHFIVLENRVGKVGVFACMRLIQKTEEMNSPLPIEEFFDDSDEFKNPAIVGSIEVSRFIVRHEKPIYGMIAKKQLITTGMAYLSAKMLGPIYAVVESEFERAITMAKLETKRIAKAKIVPEYNDLNLAITISRDAYEKRIGKGNLLKQYLAPGTCKHWGEMVTELGECD